MQCPNPTPREDDEPLSGKAGQVTGPGDHLTREDLGIILTLGTVALPLLFALLYPYHGRPLEERFSPELVGLLAMYDSTAQVWAYKVALASVALLWLMGFCIVTLCEMPLCSTAARTGAYCVRYLRRYGGLLILLAMPLAIMGMPRPRGTVVKAFLASAAGIFMFPLLAKRLSTAMARKAMWAFLVVYLVFFLVPGLRTTPNLATSDEVAVEWHYSFVVGPADRLSVGHVLFRDVIPDYGFILPSLIAYVERHAGILTFGSQMRFIQMLQVVFCLLALVAYRLWKPRHPLFVIFPMLVLIPWAHTFHAATWFPNQSAWRFMGFPLGAIALLLLRGRSYLVSALVLGLCSGVLILYNKETAIAMAAGYAFFLLLRADPCSIRRISTAYCVFALGFISSLAMGAFAFRVGFGYWPLPDGLTDILRLFNRYLEGFAGLRFSFDMMAGAIFVHAAYVVIRSCVVWQRKPLSFSESFKIVMGTTILVWFAYYCSRPHPWNLWSYLFLYGFFLTEYIDPHMLSRVRLPSYLTVWPIRKGVLCFILLPAIILSNAGQARVCIDKMLANVPEDAKLVSGVWLPASAADALEERAACLRSQSHPNDLLYFTSNSFLMPKLSGIYPRLPVQEPFGETLTHDDFRALVRKTKDLAPKRIFIEARKTGEKWFDEQHMAYRHRFLDRLKGSLSPAYRLTAVSCGWEIWERASP